MPCTPALFSLPVQEAQVQVVAVGTREGAGVRVSSRSSSSSSMVTQDKIVGTTLAQIHLGRGDKKGLCFRCNRPGHYIAECPVSPAHMNVAVPFTAQRSLLPLNNTHTPCTMVVAGYKNHPPAVMVVLTTRRTMAVVRLRSTHIFLPRNLHKKIRMVAAVFLGGMGESNG